MFDGMLDSVVEMLKSKGIAAVKSYPDKKAESDTELVCVSLSEAKLSPAAMGNYLGSENGEIYGIRAEVSLLLTVYAPAAGNGYARCLELAEEVRKALFDSAVGLSGFVCKDASFCADSRMFVCRCTAKCKAFPTLP